MTTIVAMHSPGFGTFIGSDTLLTSYRKSFHPEGKWCISPNKQWAIGLSGYFRVLNLVREHSGPVFTNVKSPYDVMRNLNALLDSTDYGYLQEPGPKIIQENIVIASTHGVWEVDESMSITPVEPNQIAVCGSGSQYALGAAHVLDSNLPPDVILRRCLETSCNFDPGSGGDIWLDHLIARELPADVAPVTPKKNRKRLKDVAK